MIGLVPFAVSGDNPCIYHRYELSENRLSKKISTFVHCRLYIVVNTKLQLLVRRAKLKFARVLFLKSFYRTTVQMKYVKVRKTPSQLLSLTGFTPEEFEAFIPTFEYHWNEYHSRFTLKGKPRRRIS